MIRKKIMGILGAIVIACVGITGFISETASASELEMTVSMKDSRIQFKDVTDSTQFYYEPIYWAAEQNIVTGWGDGTFRPMKECNRAAVVTFLWRMKGKPEPKTTAKFKDLTGNEEFDKAISWASETGIVEGWSDNTFRPWNICNRAAIVTFLWRYAGRPSVNTNAYFKDLTGNNEFDKAISWAASKGITTGWNDHTFRPWDTCKRLAVVSFLNRYDNVIKTEMNDVNTEDTTKKDEPTPRDDSIGTLSYEQAFCKYNDKYYCINGYRIAKLNTDFSELSNVELHTGHGNSLQLGNDGLAYVSGWDDNTIYVVNLETLSIMDTISLPTTGYTTAAIDDANGIAYIFQRDSYPDTEDNYTFITYDYVNDEIISTREINAFGAMQSCDFYNGKIVVVNGLARVTCPNGCRVYDTSGDILEEYSLDSFPNIELEGVYIDRDTQEVYISFVDRKVYRLGQL